MIFEQYNTDATVRRGVLHTRRGDIATPFFMPDATRASVRGLTIHQLKKAGIVPMVVNTYHLYLQPGTALFRDVGGVHRFMHWDGPLLSDSDGAVFKSILDGSTHVLTPERAIQIQCDIGTDMMVVLDDPRPVDVSEKEHALAVERTIRWTARCKKAFDAQIRTRGWDDTTRPLLFGVVQGGPYVHLREKCAQALTEIGFDGYGFGGRHVDEQGNIMREIVTQTAAFIPKDAPRFALGIGTPRDIVFCHSVGWDMFDCVIPTREGRHGRLFVWEDEKENGFCHTINIANAKFRRDTTPIDSSCDCDACRHYTRAYVHHLFRVKEPLGAQLAALHNLRFFMRLMDALRAGK